MVLNGSNFTLHVSSEGFPTIYYQRCFANVGPDLIDHNILRHALKQTVVSKYVQITMCGYCMKYEMLPMDHSNIMQNYSSYFFA